jgi:uncharacterized protein (TIGR01777 family)
MPVFKQSVEVPVTPAEAFAWHARTGAFARLQAPWESAEILSAPKGLAVGSGVRLRLRLLGPLKMEAEFRHTHFEENVMFVDEQVRGPFRRWRHEHRFIPTNEGHACRLEDVIDYQAPPGGNAIVHKKLQRLFAYRHRIFRADMQDWAKRGAPRPQTVLITGGTGFIGSALVARLQSLGHSVRILSRNPKAGSEQFHWDIDKGTWDASAFEGVDTLMHLAGAPIATRWSAAARERILSSRTDSTHLLVRALGLAKDKPVRILQASGINYYGYDVADPVDESCPSGDGFLAEVCRQWEAAAAEFSANGHALACVRTGVVLNPQGGALAKLLPFFKAGLGGPIGRGQRLFPWIGLEDLVEMYVFLMENPTLTGAFNAVAPEATDNANFTRTLGRVLKRPALFPVPPAILRLAMGEMAGETLLCDIRAIPARLQDAGFTFRHSNLALALSESLSKSYSTRT